MEIENLIRYTPRAVGLKPWLRSVKPCGLINPGPPRIWQGQSKRQSRRGFHALREGLWRLRNTSGMRPCRRAEALGYPGRSPPARARAEYLFKDHNFGLHSAGSGRLARHGGWEQWSMYLRNAVNFGTLGSAWVARRPDEFLKIHLAFRCNRPWVCPRLRHSDQNDRSAFQSGVGHGALYR